VEAELHLVTAEEKDLNPVGEARKDPERLPEPKYVRRFLLAFCCNTAVLDGTIHFVALNANYLVNLRCV